MLKSIGIAVTRLASSLSVGGDLEYRKVTLGRAFEGPRQRPEVDAGRRRRHGGGPFPSIVHKA